MTERDNWHNYFHKDFGNYDRIPKAHRDAMMSYLDVITSTAHTPDDYDILFAVDYLLADHLDLEDDITAITLREQAEKEGLIPSDEMFNDPETHRAAKELLLLFPLRSKEITGVVDLSYDVDTAAAWYYNTAVAILERTDEVHATCGNGTELRCNHSVQCPQRVVARLLLADHYDELEGMLNIEGSLSVYDIKTHVVADLYKSISL